jgi:hypothetical protein
MTLDKLATMTQKEFRALRSEMAAFATKDDLKHFATKDDLRELKDGIVGEVRKERQTIIESNDRVVTKLDTIIKDFAAHDSLHKEITDKLHDHDQRLRKLENAKAA